jgi:putative chitinase
MSLEQRLSPRVPKLVIDRFLEIQERFSINTDLRIAHFFAQTAHESANFTTTKENFNYSASRLLKVFPRHFNKDTAKLYARDYIAIANKVYANRFGNTELGDGWKYRGRGYIMTTFKANYAELDKLVPEDLLENPELVAGRYAMLSAGYFWHSRKLNALADKGSDVATITRITNKINGGIIGLDDRIAKFNEFYDLLTKGQAA